MNAQDRSDLTILMGMVSDLRVDVMHRFDNQDVRLKRLEDRRVADDAVEMAAEKSAERAAERSGMRMRTVVAVGSLVGSLVVGVGGLVLRLMHL